MRILQINNIPDNLPLKIFMKYFKNIKYHAKINFMSQPGEELINILELLRRRLSSSGVQRTDGLRRSMGSNCRFYRRSLDIFLDRDFDDLNTLLQKALEELGKINNVR